MSGGDTGTSRRSVLSTIGAGAFAGLAVGTSTAGATSTPSADFAAVERAREQFAAPGRARRAVAEHGADVLAALAAEGIVERSVEDLPTDALLSGAEYAEAREGTRVSALQVDGTPTAHVVVSFEAPAHDVRVVVQPHVGRSYAVASAKDGDGGYMLVDDADGDGPTTAHPCALISEGTTCVSEELCDPSDLCGTEHNQECCVHADGTSHCETLGSTGECCNCLCDDCVQP